MAYNKRLRARVRRFVEDIPVGGTFTTADVRRTMTGTATTPSMLEVCTVVRGTPGVIAEGSRNDRGGITWRRVA